MEKLIAIGNIENVSRQRNLFLAVALILLVTSSCLALKLLTTDQKIVLVPGLNQEVWVSGAGVSRSYLTETTAMYLPLLLDLNSEIIDFKASTIFKYISQSSPLYMRKIQEYFAGNKEKYKKFGLSTYFSVKNFEVSEKNLQVIANGTLTSRFGNKGLETVATSYLLSFEWTSGKLRLKEFVRLKSEAEKIEEKKQEERLQEQNKALGMGIENSAKIKNEDENIR